MSGRPDYVCSSGKTGSGRHLAKLMRLTRSGPRLLGLHVHFGNVGHRDRRLLLAQHGPRRRWSVNPALAHRGGVVPGRTRWARLLLLPFYWLTVVLIRAAGTAVGDFISGRNMRGLPVSTAVTGALFIALLVIWREQSRSERERERERER